MLRFLDFLDGRKSYLGAAAIVVAGGLMIAGVLDPGIGWQIVTVAAGLLGAGLAHKLAKLLDRIGDVASEAARRIDPDIDERD